MPDASPLLLPSDTLDLTFSGDGLISLEGSSGDEHLRRLALAADGSSVLVGWRGAVNAGAGDITLLRLTASGALDTGFGSAGWQTVALGGSALGQDVALTADGHILVLAETGHGSVDSDLTLLRYTATGSLDTTFDADGRLDIRLSTGRDEAAALAVQADGKLLVLASRDADNYATARITLLRYNADGTADTGFGNNGVALADFNWYESAQAMALQPDGKIVVAGHVWTGNDTTAYDLVVARFNANGSLDATFSGDGLQQIDLGTYYEHAYALALQTDGKIVLAGQQGTDAALDAVLLRLNANGERDTTFGGGDGLLTLDVSSADSFTSVLLQADGKIVAAGSEFNEYGHALLARYLPDGTLDSTFATGGVLTSYFAYGTSVVQDLALTPQGQLLAIGDSFTGTWDAGALRLSAGVPAQHALSGSTYNYAVPNGIFFDADTAALSYHATQANGAPLPTWLHFDATQRLFSGTPAEGDFGSYQLTLTASDGTSSTSSAFTLNVRTPFIDALLFPDQFRWNAQSPLGTSGTTLSYSFMAGVPGFASTLEQGTFAPMTSAQQDAVRAILRYYSEIVGLHFVETSGASAQIQFGTYLETGTQTAGYATSISADLSAIWINRAFPGYDAPLAGDHHYETLLHEVGHALGLKHPGNYDAGSQPPYLDVPFDSTQYTVMSYHQRANALYLDVQPLPDGSHEFLYQSVDARSAMLYDVATLQYLYGANASTRAGNDLYTFDPARPFFETLWDGAGIDTLSVAGFATPNRIDLRPGQFSSVGIVSDPIPDIYTGGTPPTYDGSNNLAIAYHAWIENAIGGSANDVLIGNALDNQLTGGPGDDSLDGMEGNDTAIYVGNRADYTLAAGNASSWTLSGPEGTDTLSRIERLVFADQTVDLVATPAGRTLALKAYSWKTHTLLDGVSVAGGGQNASTANGGGASLDGITDSTLSLSASRTVAGSETTATNSAVNLQDAIAILKLIVGLPVNGSNPMSPYQAYAADFDGNGAVALTDAIGVLKHVVGLSAPSPSWVFFNEADATVAGKYNPSSKTVSNPTQPGVVPTLVADLSNDPAHVGLVGVLRGDVDGSYTGGGTQALPTTYFGQLPGGIDLAQFAIYPQI